MVPAGHKLSESEPTPLFRKISDAEVEEFRARYAGNQADRAAAAAAVVADGCAAPAAVAVGGKKDKKVEKKSDANGTTAAAAPKEGGKKEKKASGDTAAAAGKKPADDRPADISRIDLRVGLIKKAWRHPDADRYFALGFLKTNQIYKLHYPMKKC